MNVLNQTPLWNLTGPTQINVADGDNDTDNIAKAISFWERRLILFNPPQSNSLTSPNHSETMAQPGSADNEAEISDVTDVSNSLELAENEAGLPDVLDSAADLTPMDIVENQSPVEYFVWWV